MYIRQYIHVSLCIYKYHLRTEIFLEKFLPKLVEKISVDQKLLLVGLD